MTIILAIETSTELASVALLYHDQLILRESQGVQTHSETVLPMVQQLLREADMTLARCDAIACGIGPGSFTGVRTACSIVQGLAFGADLPVLPVVTLEAVAQACLEQVQATEVLVVLDARMKEVYWAQYRHHATGWQTVHPPTLSAPHAVLPQGAVQACGNGLTVYAQNFAEQAFAAAGLAQLMPHARQIAVLGKMALAQGHAMSLQEAQPLYLRNKVALTTAERQVCASMKNGVKDAKKGIA